MGHPATFTVHGDTKVQPLYSYGDEVQVYCWVEGPWRDGFDGKPTNVWDVLYTYPDDATQITAVPDAWVDTGGDTSKFVGRCY